MKFKNNLNYNTRKVHRYMGLFIGIQFFFWTLGGLYFSWNNMDDVHGETLLKQERNYFEDINFSQVQKGIDSLKTITEIDSIHSIKVIEAFKKPIAQFHYFKNGKFTTQLINLETGNLRNPFSEEESLQMVQNRLKEPIAIEKMVLVDENSVSGHHEYRGKPLPAYAFVLDHSTKTTIYVATELGQITSVRNNNWRRFDFLWMLHVMDYSTRDNITNWTLRIFSGLGLITISSGFMLFYLTSRTVKKIKKKKNS
tara:strand:- start:2405 stop:3166 length:762 start_codon:yes stop_codon:yes gene_type:complete